MAKLHIYDVTHMHGGWVTDGYPKERVVASSKDEALEMVLDKQKYWDRRNTYASEFTIDGYIIEVYDEKTYKRDKAIKSLEI
jgi:hypothetical protein